MKYIFYSLKLFLFVSLLFAGNSTFCQITLPEIAWQRTIGSAFASCIRQTADGGYIVAGKYNFGTEGSQDEIDCWVAKLNAEGSIEWQRWYGGSDIDAAASIQQTTDGGYIVAGGTRSNDGDVTGHHGSPAGYVWDSWIVKLDTNGNIEWEKSLGGSYGETAASIQQTTDGGYIVASSTQSNDGDVSGNHGGYDIWVVKLNATGSIEWQKCLGGLGDDGAQSIQQTADSGYIVAGITQSNDGDVSGNHGGLYPDIWVVKLNTSGDLQWQKCLGGSAVDMGSFIQQTTDGGYIVAGNTGSHDGDVSGNHGGYDIWVVKLNATGSIEWQKCLGGSAWENDDPSTPPSIRQTADGGYIVAGDTNSNDGDVSGNHGGFDIWVVKLNATGSIEWQKCLGGSGQDGQNEVFSILQTTNGGYIVACNANSTDGDLSGAESGNKAWIVKLNSCNATLTEVGRTIGDGGIFCPDVHTIELEYSSSSSYTRWEVGNANLAELVINDGHFYAQKGETITVKLPAPIESDHKFIFIAHSGNLKCLAKYVASGFPTKGCDGTVTPTLIRPASSPQSDDGVFGFQINTSACTDQGNLWAVLLRNTLTGVYYGNNEPERYVAVGGLPAGTYSVSFGDVGSICRYMDVATITVPVSSSGRLGSGAAGGEMTARLAANPAHNTAVVSITGGKPVSVSLSDLSGRVLWKKDNAAENNITIPLQNIVKGNYLVKVSDGKTSSTLKLVKE